MKFVKMHGLGNDFILFEDHRADADYSGTAIRLCHRQLGIGGDGLVAVLPSEKADVRMRIINCDGSEAEMCGNAIRCFAKYVYEKGMIRRDTFSVETLGGIVRPKLFIDRGIVMQVRVDMGEPRFDRSLIPMAGPGGMVVNEPLIVGGERWDITAMSLGVPHTVIFVDEVREEVVKTVGPKIERHVKFPQKTNVNFVKVIDDGTIQVRTWERGAGPTLACGTGACASVVAAFLNGLAGRQVKARLLLGDLLIDYTEDGTVYMSGPAEKVFEGETDLA
ncbi:MAG: diaminopimelate epimerase [Bacillota bacterium]|nr:diaminopimelate epimerase [Bacillota bacterium]